MISPQRVRPGPLTLGDNTGSLYSDPLSLSGHEPLSEPDGPGCPRTPATGAQEEQGLLGPIPMSLCACLPHPPPHSRPWHSNQCPLTSHLAISVNQLKLARCHKNIYTFYAIGAFKSSSCALLPRKLHPILDWTAQKGGTGCPRQGWAGAAGAALPGPELTTDPA